MRTFLNNKVGLVVNIVRPQAIVLQALHAKVLSMPRELTLLTILVYYQSMDT